GVNLQKFTDGYERHPGHSASVFHVNPSPGNRTRTSSLEPALESCFDLGRLAELDLLLQAAAISLIFGLASIFAPEIMLWRAQRVTNSGLPEQLEPESHLPRGCRRA